MPHFAPSEVNKVCYRLSFGIFLQDSERFLRYKLYLLCYHVFHTFRPRSPPLRLVSIMSCAIRVTGIRLPNKNLETYSVFINNLPNGSTASKGIRSFCITDWLNAALALAITGSRGSVWQPVLMPKADDIITSRVSLCWCLKMKKNIYFSIYI